MRAVGFLAGVLASAAFFAAAGFFAALLLASLPSAAFLRAAGFLAGALAAAAFFAAAGFFAALFCGASPSSAAGSCAADSSVPLVVAVPYSDAYRATYSPADLLQPYSPRMARVANISIVSGSAWKSRTARSITCSISCAL